MTPSSSTLVQCLSRLFNSSILPGRSWLDSGAREEPAITATVDMDEPFLAAIPVSAAPALDQPIMEVIQRFIAWIDIQGHALDMK